MKLAALLNNRFTEFEARKKLTTLKNVDNAYKRNAKFFNPTTNPALDELIDLLTGKKDQKDNSELQQTIQQIQSDSKILKNHMFATDEDVVVAVPPDNKKVQFVDARQFTMERLTKKAISTYQNQMQMAKQGYSPIQPMIYRTA